MLAFSCLAERGPATKSERESYQDVVEVTEELPPSSEGQVVLVRGELLAQKVGYKVD